MLLLVLEFVLLLVLELLILVLLNRLLLTLELLALKGCLFADLVLLHVHLGRLLLPFPRRLLGGILRGDRRIGEVQRAAVVFTLVLDLRVARGIELLIGDRVRFVSRLLLLDGSGSNSRVV